MYRAKTKRNNVLEITTPVGLPVLTTVLTTVHVLLMLHLLHHQHCAAAPLKVKKHLFAPFYTFPPLFSALAALADTPVPVPQGRGELQIGILVETLRREGFEMTVSPPKVRVGWDRMG